MPNAPSPFALHQVWKAIGRIGMKRGFQAEYYVIAKLVSGNLTRICKVPCASKNARQVKHMVTVMGDKTLVCFPVFKNASGQFFPSDMEFINLIVLETSGTQQRAQSLCVGV